MFSNKCPVCGKGALFKDWINLHELCENCGSRYERHEGAWIGPTMFGYGVGAVFGVGLGAVVVLTGNYFPMAEIYIGLLACLTAFVSYRYMKGAWVGMLHQWGHVYPDTNSEE